jgi:peptide/nickel transport system substrate-binding protein
VRFVGYSLYDALVLFDLSKSDKASDIRPGLATSWAIAPENPKRWIFKLREGVQWHDGCPFVADAGSGHPHCCLVVRAGEFHRGAQT